MNRLERIQQIRQKLASGIPSIGSWIQIPHSSVAEIIGASGYDWAAIDMEHGSISYHQLPDLCRALELRSTLPLVRLAEGSAKEAKSALDAGAGGIIVPMIEHQQQLFHIIEVSRWPPAGRRGVGFSRANLFGSEFDDYKAESQAPLIVAMIESRQALNNLEELVRVSGLDALMIGPYDLSASLGFVGQFDHPDYLSALQQIKHTASHANIPLGLHVVEPISRLLRDAVDNRFLFCAYGIDSVFLSRSASNPFHHQNS